MAHPLHTYIHTYMNGMEQISSVIYLVLESPTTSCLISAVLTVNHFNYNLNNSYLSQHSENV
jgi:hypothetical protein